MEKIKLIFIVISLMAVFTSSAQKFKAGAISGFSTSQIDRDTQKGYDKLSFFSGVFVKAKFSKILGAKVELYYIGKGAKDSDDKIEIFKTQLNYIEMPFLLTIKPLNNFEIDLGLSPAYLISSKLTAMGYEVDESEYDINNYDFSGIFSLIYYFNNKIAINVRHTYSITPINDTPGWLNSNLNFGLVYNFN